MKSSMSTRARAILVIALILVSGIGGYITWWYMQPKAFSTVSGLVHLDEPIVDATLSLYDMDGVKVFESEDATSTTGSFAINVGWGAGQWGGHIPNDFMIVASGGTIDNEPFTGTVLRVVNNYSEEHYYHLNAITTLINHYLDRHPEMTYIEAEEAVKDFLNVPEFIGIDLVVDSAMYYHGIFDHEYFMLQAEEHSNFDEFIDVLSEEIDLEGKRIFVATGGSAYSASVLGAYKDLATGLGKGLADKFGGPVGGAVAGWVFSDIFGIKSAEQKDLDEIKKRLDEQNSKLNKISAQLDDLKDQVDEMERKLESELHKLAFTKMANDADIAVDNIRIRHELLIGYSELENVNELQQDETKFNDLTRQINKLVDEITSTDAGTWHDLNTIHENLINRGGTWGMIDLWSMATIAKMNETVQYLGPPDPRTNIRRLSEESGKALASSTPQAYEESWAFYDKYLIAQLQGYTLLIEAYHSRNDIAGAKTAFRHMNETITEQVLQLKSSIEQKILWLLGGDVTILWEKEFPFMEVSKWYQHKGWDYTSKFERLDQDINLILGSMKTPASYVSFTARVLLWPQLVERKGFPTAHDFANGLPLTFRNVDTGIEYTVTGTRINPEERDMQIWALRYEFKVPAGIYVLVKPTDVWDVPLFSEGKNGWQNVGPIWDESTGKFDLMSDSYEMSLGTGFEVRNDGATYWGGVWAENNPFPIKT